MFVTAVCVNVSRRRDVCFQCKLESRDLQGCGSFSLTERSNDIEAGLVRSSDAGYEALIRLYLLADKLQDLATANMVMDELIRFVSETDEVPKHLAVSLAYGSTTNTSILRALLRVITGSIVGQMPVQSSLQITTTRRNPSETLLS